MRVETLSIADFYNNPDEVRAFALSQDFSETGNYPGKRTVPFFNDSIKETIQNVIRPFAGEVTWWGDVNSGAFQYTTSADRSWIHSDGTTHWAGVCYLTPDAPLSGGTGIFRYKKTGSMTEDGTDLSGVTQDMTKWELVDRVGNVYNRLVLYRGNNYHMSLDYFGKDKDDGRLFQLFFITTEY